MIRSSTIALEYGATRSVRRGPGEGMTGRRRRRLPAKLDRRFDTVRPANEYGRTYSYAEVAALAEANGGPSISASYIHALRHDPVRRPTRDALQALAAAFGVSVVYFFDDE